MTHRRKAKCIQPLTERRDFLRLRAGKRYRSTLMTVQALNRQDHVPDPCCRVGFTVTTKIGNAVERNRIKRRLRMAVLVTFPGSAYSGYDYAIIARRACLNAEFASITQDLHRALDHVDRNEAKGCRTAKINPPNSTNNHKQDHKHG